MKKLFLILAICISLSAFSQKDTTHKIDSTQIFLQEVGSKLTIEQFRTWLYDKAISPQKYDEFMQWVNGYLQEQYNEWMKKNKK